MTDDRVARWERLVQSYLTSSADLRRLERRPAEIDPDLADLAILLDRHDGILEQMLDTPSPHLSAFGFKLRVAPQMLTLHSLAEKVFPALLSDWRSLTGVDAGDGSPGLMFRPGRQP